MKQVLTGIFLAATFAGGLSAQSAAPPQSPYPQAPPMRDSKESKDAAKTLTVTGCLKAGDLADSFILSDLKWSDKAKGTGPIGTSGSVALPAEIASATTLKIIPGPTTKLSDHVGHTVELTGTVGDKDKADRDATTTPPPHPTPESTPPSPSASSGPSFEVRTLKMVSGTCTPQ